MPPHRKSSPPGHRALRRGRASLAHHVYHVTASTHGRCRVFAGFEAACAAAATFTSRTTLGAAIPLAWVLMPDHAHFLLPLGPNDPPVRVVNRITAPRAPTRNPT